MKLSVFTPTHNARYLAEAHDSIAKQPYEDWEWIIAPNAKAGADLPTIPDQVSKSSDERIKIMPFFWADKPMVGELKRFCCDQATGDVFIELDHDDLLVPGIFSAIAAKAKEGAGFIFSDVAAFESKSRQPWSYDERWGWESYDFRVYGSMCRATRNFEPSPRSLCEVYYAPDHVRCWSRDAYYSAGGHDPTLEVGDDHDLICRTYIDGAKFSHTGGCGYLYRSHGKNTVKTHNGQIQVQQAANRDKYFFKLVDQWLKRTKNGYLDLEMHPPTMRDGMISLAEIKDNSIGCVKAYGDSLPTVPHDQITNLMNEIYRVLVPGGYFCGYFPSSDGRQAFAPCYKSFWNQHTFDYYTKKEWAKKIPESKARFQAIRIGTTASSKEREKLRFFETYVDLCALKGQRQPGRVFI